MAIMIVHLLLYGIDQDIEDYCHSYYFWKDEKLRSGSFEIYERGIRNFTKDHKCPNFIYEEEEQDSNYTKFIVEMDKVTKENIEKAIPEVFL